MKTTARRLPAAPTALAAALLTAFLVLFAPLSASAHDSLLASSPEADSTVDILPAELTLTFSAKLIDGEGATEIVVTDPEGDSVIDGAPTLNGAVVTQPLVSEAPAGAYHVVWKVVSSDGHPTSGEFDFTVANATESTATAEPTASPTTAEPTPAATAGPGTDVTPAPEESDSSPATTMIWVLGIAGVLVILGIVVWLVTRGRSGSAPADSGAPSER
ncbi:methionine-rich copper-binding protein CopC [Microbacterium phyllosphaerae]|uniref:Methionine-rich copper-binding protein CopC n=1 Tax=Microbacterium phyllosphaerae TaxID=124798 RepID=A0ABS4WST5_9MICO|nr:copper resistance CopC family protein [Microbacterium phyllosphaerae]MBP2379240.1 methionine-rich copper-binding protein CopC [Microbacterium phyllosphaerae]